MMSSRSSGSWVALALFAVACGGGTPSTSHPSPSTGAPDVHRGARLYDNWMREKNVGDAFKADSSKTPELDGTGGPRSNGTLADGSGQPLANTGHDYRLKNLFGWDLRGRAGVYGPDYHAKAYALDGDLLASARTAAELAAWLRQGDAQVPAYGAVLDERDVRDLAHFVVATRDGRLPRPDLVFELSKDAPKNYVLRSGAEPARGAALFAERCSDCHGSTGTEIVIDGKYSAGTMARANGYEIWFKIAHGHPGSDMKEQVTDKDGDGTAQSQAVLDILAALCDRSKFPAREGGEDVPDGDPRCALYLR